MRLTEEFEDHADDEPCYVISIAARMVGMHAQTLRQYERMQRMEAEMEALRQELQRHRDRRLPARLE